MKIAQPRFETGTTMLIAGLGGHYTGDTKHEIPAMWERFGAQYFGRVPGQVGQVSYGVSYNFAPNVVFDYIAGVEVSSLAGLPNTLAQLRIAPQRYAVFAHDGHVSRLGESWMAIFGEWLPKSGHEFGGDPSYERYDAEFDPKTGLGGMEIWVSIRK